MATQVTEQNNLAYCNVCANKSCQYLHNMLKYENVIESNKYADSNVSALPIKKLIESAIQIYVAKNDEDDFLCTPFKENQELKLNKANLEEPLFANDVNPVAFGDVFSNKNMKNLISQQINFEDELNEEVFLPGQPVYVAPKFDSGHFSMGNTEFLVLFIMQC